MEKHRLKILLVDDDEDDYVITRDLLSDIEGTDIELEWLSTYEAGLNLAVQNSHDVYLFDFHLGERDGLELLKETLKAGCNGPIILLTGQGDRDVDIEAMESGAADFLLKSKIDSSSLERSIRYAIGHKESKDQILQMAYYDDLTGLPNRVLFQDRLKLGIASAQRYKRISAILFLDLDNFKRINDTLGHNIGDMLLKAVAKRLNDCLRPTDTVTRNVTKLPTITIARLGGDEFTIYLNEISHVEDAAKVAQRILDSLIKPFLLHSQEVFISTSIGIALYPFDGNDMDTLLKNADIAMYHAKAQGKNNFQHYRQSMNDTALEKLDLENDLRRALNRNEFVLFYQPQINFRTGKIIGIEALIRWQHPEKGLILPGQFISLAEEIGLIDSLGDWVLQTACNQINSWRNEGFPAVTVSVNLSSKQLKQKAFIQNIKQTIKSSQIPPTCLILEITETSLMENKESVIAILDELNKMGIRLSIDDFGTGYSSLAYLKRFPIYGLKIDRSFIKEIGAIQDDEAITSAIIAMAHRLNLHVIAEGVETEQQLRFLSDQGCEDIQGFLISRPVPENKMLSLLIKEKKESTIVPFQLASSL